jgi:hypothetical protein
VSATSIQRRDHAVNSVSASHRLSAIAIAISVTFGIVWALSNYAYPELTGAGSSPIVVRTAQAKACS